MATSIYDHDFSSEKQEKTINNEKMEKQEIIQESEERKHNILVRERTLQSLLEKSKKIDAQINALDDSKFECWKKLREIESKRKYGAPVGDAVCALVVSGVASFISGVAGKLINE